VTSSDSAQFRTGPDVTIHGAEQRTEPVTRDARRIASVECGKPNAIEANETIKSCEPQITIRSLTDRPNDVLWQPAIRSPRIDRNLGGCRKLHVEEKGTNEEQPQEQNTCYSSAEHVL
jgi:hypothetical protein